MCRASWNPGTEPTTVHNWHGIIWHTRLFWTQVCWMLGHDGFPDCLWCYRPQLAHDRTSNEHGENSYVQEMRNNSISTHIHLCSDAATSRWRNKETEGKFCFWGKKNRTVPLFIPSKPLYKSGNSWWHWGYQQKCLILANICSVLALFNVLSTQLKEQEVFRQQHYHTHQTLITLSCISLFLW